LDCNGNLVLSIWDQTIGVGFPSFPSIAEYAIDLWYRVIVRLFLNLNVVEVM